MMGSAAWNSGFCICVVVHTLIITFFALSHAVLSSKTSWSLSAVLIQPAML